MGQLKQIFIASDHGGFLKKSQIISALSKKGFSLTDLGPYTLNPQDDYVDYASKVATEVQKDISHNRGILFCRSGNGMCIAANKFFGIRASTVRSVQEAIFDREHDDTNILVLSGDLEQKDSLDEIAINWITTDFTGGRHDRRVKKIELIEAESINKSLKRPIVVPNLTFDSLKTYIKYAHKYQRFSHRIHVDIMDGKYVNTISPDVFDILERLQGIDVFLSLHLMIKNPAPILEKISKYRNVYLVYVHCEEIEESLLKQEFPFELGIAVKPDINIKENMYLLNKVNVLLILTINPGDMGTPFEKRGLDNILKVRKLGYKGEIHMDGGINLDTINEIMKYSPDLLNIGSAIAKAQNPRAMYEKLIKMAS